MISARFWICLAAVIIRLVLLPAPGFPTDVEAFASWMHALAAVGPRGIYLDTSNLHYPAVDYSPGYLYILWALAALQHLVMGNYSGILLDRMLVKIPACIADFGLAFSVASIVDRISGPIAATRALAVLLLSPVLWMISALWGQVDVFAALGLVLCIRAALSGRFWLMWVLAALTVLIKPQPIVAMPMLFIYQGFRQRQALPLILGPIVSVVTAYLAALPAAPSFMPVQTMHWLLDRYTFGVAKYPNGSSGAFNIYTIFGNAYQPDTIMLGRIPLHIIGTVLAIIAIAGTSLRLITHFRGIRDDITSGNTARTAAILLIQSMAIAIFALFLLMTRMHERYEMSAIVLLPIIATLGIMEDRAAKILIVDFIVNCAFILVGFYGGHHHPQVLSIVHIISLLNVIAFVLLVFSFTKRCDRHNTMTNYAG